MDDSTTTNNSKLILKDGIAARLSDSNKILFIRYKIERPSTGDKPLSKTDHFGVASVPGFIGVFVSPDSSLKHIRVCGVKIRKLDPPKIIDDCPFIYRVIVFEGETEPTDPVEDFYFAEIRSGLNSEQETTDWLATFVRKFRDDEVRESQRKSADMEMKRLIATPARLHFEDETIDHHKNWREVGTELLSKEWVCFFKANGKLLAAKDDSEIARLRVEVWKAYIVDHKALSGELPKLSESDKAELLADDGFIRSLSEALSRPKSPVDVVTWQMFHGWIVKNYYRMNDAALQKAFNKDWNYKTNQHKGNTLAKRARGLGLLFALKRGRPENPNSLPTG
jgi:hypothetical protein